MLLIRTWGKRLMLLAPMLIVIGALLPTQMAHAANLTAGTAAELIAAINTANGTSEPDTITLTGNITLLAANNNADGANGLPSITSEITIAGGGFIVARDFRNAPAFRLLHVAGSGNLTLQDVTLNSGSAAADFGGGIYNSIGGTLTMIDSQIAGSIAARGGGIYNTNGTVTVTNSTVSGNTAQDSGGGIYNTNGTLTVTNSTVSSNTARFGGGIYNSIGGTLTVTNSTVSSNTVQGVGGGIYGGDSGTATVTVTSSTVSSNTAQDSGGGIYIAFGELSVTNSTVSSNTVQGVGGGGGISSNNSRMVTVTNSTVSGNDANLGGGIYNTNGGTVTVTNSTVSGNTTQSFGGGIYSGTGTVTVTNSTVSGNGADLGGGIYNTNFFSTVTVTNSTVSGNTARQGGGIAGFGSTMIVRSSIIAGNTTSLDNINCDGTITDSGGNFSENIADDNCPVGFGNIVPGTDYSTTLTDNTGPTQTLALLAGSIAIDQSAVTLRDQRGVTFQVGSRDSGAFEFGAFATYPTVGFASTGATYKESDGTVSVPLTVTGAQNFGGTASVYIMDLGNGTATSGTDYAAFPVTEVNIDCSFFVSDCADDTANVTLTLNTDALVEPGETINLQIVSTNGFAVLGSETFTATIAATDIISPSDAMFVINRLGNDPTDGIDDANDAIADVDNDGDIDADDLQLVINALGTVLD